ncbi:MAG: nitronate monooxygenase [Verrucomicrobia bacterium]|nr:nitronate monooxygenase [Verrucomicrobiota bacterium]
MIIQGGMGVAVSNWMLARTISRLGQLGVVSGTAPAVILARRLQVGDPSGQMRHALKHFPYPDIAERVLAEFFIPGGKPSTALFKNTSLPQIRLSADLVELTVVGNFVEVFLAKEGHSGLVGINFLEKIQFPTLPSLFGAMLAGVDYVLMGAGIPRAIPGALDRLANGEPAEMKVDVEGALPGEEFLSKFDPQAFCGGTAPRLKRPQFLAIVASATLAMSLAKKSSGRVNGFIVEGESAGGHNAPPRGPLQLSPIGEPVYGLRDVPDLKKIRALGLPFWLAGSYAKPEKLAEALQAGAAGIQVGTAFAFCDESGICPELKKKVVEQCLAGTVRVFTDPVASPTGFPFKVLQMESTVSDAARYAARERICDLGYLRHAYRKPDGSVGYRCPAEPAEDYLRKGGVIEDTLGRKCICNGLLATAGFGQVISENETELALLTSGDEVVQLARLIKPGRDSYAAADVVRYLLNQTKQPL